MKFVLDFAAKTAGLKDATELADALGDELKADESAGKAMASALKAAADKAERALADTLEIADKLGDSLGHDLRQSIGQSKIDEMAVKLQQAGLRATDLDGNLDSITDSLRRMDVASNSAQGRLGDVGRAMERVGTEADRSRGVMANMMGNAVQELPVVAGAMGPLNVALGQFAEYATEGNISLKGLAATAGPMAGVGAAVWYLNQQFDLMKKKDAFRTERVKSYEEALRKGGNAVDALADHLRELGKIEMQTTMNAANPFADATTDMTDELIRAGLTVEDYTRLVTGSAEGIRAWGEHMKRAGADSKLVADVTLALGQAHEDYSKAADNATKSAKFFGDEQHRAARESRSLADALDAQQQAWDRLNNELDLQDITEEAQAALRDTEMSARDVKRSVHDYMAEVLRVPATLTTKIDIAIDQGSYAEAEAMLARLTRMRNTTYFPAANGSRAAAGQRDFTVDAADTVDALKAFQRAGGDVPWG